MSMPMMAITTSNSISVKPRRTCRLIATSLSLRTLGAPGTQIWVGFGDRSIPVDSQDRESLAESIEVPDAHSMLPLDEYRESQAVGAEAHRQGRSVGRDGECQ